MSCAKGRVTLVSNVSKQSGFRRPFKTDHGSFAANVMKDLAGDQSVVNKIGVVAVNKNGRIAITCAIHLCIDRLNPRIFMKTRGIVFDSPWVEL